MIRWLSVNVGQIVQNINLETGHVQHDIRPYIIWHHVSQSRKGKRKK